MNVWLGTREQKIAACTVLLMAGLCILDYKDQFDMPHLHIEGPVMPTTFAAISASASNTASIFTLLPLNWNGGP